MKYHVTLLSSIVETPRSAEPGIFSSFTPDPAGQPYAAAIVDAVIADYYQATQRNRPEATAWPSRPR